MRFASAIVVLAASFPVMVSATPSSAACSQLPQRKIVYWTDYSRGENADYEAEFGHLRTIINKEISRLPYYLSPSGLQAGDIAELESHPRGADKPVQYPFSGLADRRAWWVSAKTIIGILHGSIYSSPPIKVFSNVYSEDLNLPKVANNPGMRGQTEAQALIDSHNLVFAYVLAMDAQGRKCSKATIYGILERANEIAQQLKTDNRLDGDLEVVAQAVEQKLKDLAGP